MGFASLGFDDGPSITFRVDPESVEWGFKINTTVIPTVAGRVVQVLGATLSDMTVTGKYGQNVKAGLDGQSWKQAEAFAKKIQEIQSWQSRDSREFGKMHVPAIFNYAPKNWRFQVYVKSLADSRGGSVTHQSGRFSYDYALTLFIVDAISDDLEVLKGPKAQAVDQYIARISNGIGWHFSQFNGQVPPNPIGDLFGKDKFSQDGAAQQQTPTTP